MKRFSIIKICSICLLLITLIVPVFAGEAAEEGGKGNFDLGAFENGTVPEKVDDLTKNSLGTAITIMRVVGVGIAIIILMVIACKYMISAPGDRADIKKHAVPYVVGAVVLFGASGILTILLNFSEKISA